MELLKQLIEVQGASGDEGRIHNFIVDYVEKNAKNWKVQPGSH